MAHLSINISDAAILVVTGSAIYALLLFIYRLTLSPLAKFPGPRLAAATHFYEFYYDVIKRGRYEFKIQDLHERYGPIVRINPEELHVHDPDFHPQLYVGSNVRQSDRPVSMRNLFAMTQNIVATVEHDVHRGRRKALEPFFSKKKITELEPVIQSKAQRVSERLLLLKGTGTPVSLIYPFSAATSDIISNYCFGESWESLEKEDFNAAAYRLQETYLRLTSLFRQFPWIGRSLMRIPTWMIGGTGVISIARCTEQVARKIASIVHERSSDDKHGSTTIFHELLRNSALPPQELTEKRLLDEALSPEILAKLQTELAPLMAEYPTKIPKMAELEALPYLNAIVTEGLRMYGGGPHRIQRVSPDEDLKYREWNIPAGTAVGMSSTSLQEYEPVFPEPKRFRPERWLEGDLDLKRKYFVPFSRGSRMCIGINLAFAEAYHILAAVFRPHGIKMELFETDETDVIFQHDFIIPSPKLDSLGVRVVIS